MHMLLVHGRPAQRDKCDSCDRDTKVINDKDIIEDEKEAVSGEINEAICEITEHTDEEKPTNDLRDTSDQNETSHQADIADVTSVIRTYLKQRTML